MQMWGPPAPFTLSCLSLSPSSSSGQYKSKWPSDWIYAWAQMSWGLQAGETALRPPPPAQRGGLAEAVKWSAQLLIAVMVLREAVRAHQSGVSPEQPAGGACGQRAAQRAGWLPRGSHSSIPSRGAEGPDSFIHSLCHSVMWSWALVGAT